MKKLIIFIVSTISLSLPLSVHAQVFSQSQVINQPYGSGVIVSTSTANGGHLEASTSPSVANIFTTSISASSSIKHLTVAQLSIASLSGFLKAVGGYITTALVNLASDVTGILPVANGGTGVTSLTGLITTGDLASANISQFTNDRAYLSDGSNGGSNVFSAAPPLTFNPATDQVSIGTPISVTNGGTAASSFGQGWIYSTGGTTALAASTSPTVAYITATSTSHASTLPYASTTAISATTVCLVGDSCRTTWPTSGGGGSGSVATSAAETANYVPFYTSTNGTPATIGADSQFVWDPVNHRLGIGTSTPAQALDIVGTEIRQSNTTADATNKAFKFVDRNFTNSQEDFLLLFGQSKTSGNTLLIGGGQAGTVAASAVSIFTGAGNNTDTGTNRFSVDSTGNVSIPILTGGLVQTSSAGLLSNISTSTLGLTVSSFASPNISQWTNNSGYLTSLSGAASSTALADNNTFSGNDTFSNTITGSISGNAGTATALQNPRTINGVSFNGTANIVVASTTLLGDNNTFSGNDTFNNTITGSISGNAGTATILQNTRTINSVSFNGSANIVINAASSSLLGDSNTWSGQNTFNSNSFFANLIGGTANNSTLDLKPTTNSAPTTAAINFRYGNNGSSIAGTVNGTTGLWTITNASSTLFSATTEWLPSLATPAGTFLAVDSNGKIIATSTPAVGGGGTVTLVTGTSGLTGSVTTSGSLSLDQAFGAIWTAASSTYTGHLALNNASTTQFSSPTIWNSTVGNALWLGDSTGKATAYSGSSCTNQFPRSVSATGAWTCATVANTDLANSSIVVNGTTFNLGDNKTITAASSSVLSDNDTFSGNDTFSNTITGSITGNAGTATKLITARAINGINFDGTGPITIQAASSSALGDNNTFSGNNLFTASSTYTKVVNQANASTSLLTVGTQWIPSLGTAAGSFIAVDPNGKLIATTTPSGSSLVSGTSLAVQLATAGALPSNTYSSGVLTEVGTGALTVDGTAVSVGNRILVKNEAAQTNNGIYSVTAAGSGIAAYVLTRVSDYNSSANVVPGEATYVINGSTLSDDWWALTTAAPITVGGGGSGSNLTYVETNGSTMGTVTSITAATPNSTLTLGGTNPVTSSGTINFDLNLTNPNAWTGRQNFNNSTSTLGTITTGWATNWNDTYSSSTAITVSGQEAFSNLSSAIVITNGSGVLANYAGSSNPCAANQGVTTLSALGVLGGCTATFLTGNQSITLSGDVTGSGATAITTAFNLANTHYWTATQNFTNASTSQFTATSTSYLQGLTNFGSSAQSNISASGVLSLGTALAVSSGGTGLTSTSQNFVFAGPTSGSGAPTWRAVVAADIPTLNQNTSGSAGSVANAVTFNNGGAGASSGQTYNGSSAQTISYNTIGAQVAGTYVTAVNGTTNQIASSGGTTPTLSFPNLVVFPVAASSTRLSVFGNAYFGGSATSTFDNAGDLTLPAAATLNGAGLTSCAGSTFLQWSSGLFSCGTPAGGGGTPGGATTQVQFNGNGGFEGDQAFVFATSSGLATLTVGKPSTSINAGALALSYAGSVSDALITFSTVSSGGSSGNKTITVPAQTGTLCLTTTCPSTVSNSDASLTISPTTGSVIASINAAHTNTWTTVQDFFFASAPEALFDDTTTGNINAANIDFHTGSSVNDGIMGTVSSNGSGTGDVFGLGYKNSGTSFIPVLTWSDSGLVSTTNASTSLFSVFGKSYFGGSSTTTIDSAGNIVIPSAATLTNTGITNGCATWASGVLGTTGSSCGGAGSQTPWTSAINGGGFALSNAGLITATSFTATSSTATSTFPLLYVGNTGNSGNNVIADFIGQRVQMGPVQYPANYVPSCSTCFYLMLDKSSTGNDVSEVFRDQGNARAEIGLLGDDSLHFKTVTGTYGSESFSDVMTLTPAKNVGIGTTSPTSLLSIGTNSNFTFDYVGDASTTGSITIDGSFVGPGQAGTGNGVMSIVGHEASGQGAYERIRDDVLGTVAYFGQNSVINGGTAYSQFDVQNPQSTGTLCFSAGARSSATANSGCDILDTAAGNIGFGTSTPWSAITLGPVSSITTTENVVVSAATINVNWKNGNQQTEKMTGPTTIQMGFNTIPGQTERLVICQDGTGSRALTWGLSSSSIIWAGGTAPTQTATANACDVYSFLVTSATSTTVTFGAVTQNFP